MGAIAQDIWLWRAPSELDGGRDASQHGASDPEPPGSAPQLRDDVRPDLAKALGEDWSAAQAGRPFGNRGKRQAERGVCQRVPERHYDGRRGAAAPMTEPDDAQRVTTESGITGGEQPTTVKPQLAFAYEDNRWSLLALSSD